MRKRIIIAIDSWKGCLTSTEANRAAADGIHAVSPDAETLQIAVSDGGEGWLEAFHTAIGGEISVLTVCDPLMRPVAARYLTKGDTAVIEMAQASGLTLLSPEERNPLRATSYGTGQLIAHAVNSGCSHIIVGLGGSATSDCGIGMLHAIADCLNGRSTPTASDLFDPTLLPRKPLEHVRFTIATDVSNPLCGKNGAAQVFAPQKGATPEMVSWLDERARQEALLSARHFGYDRQDMPGAGAAGGLGYAFLQYLNAACRSGIDLLLDTIRFDQLLKDTAMVITGEGTADRQTLMGKLPYGILRRCQRHQVPVYLIAGRVADRQTLLQAGFAQIDCINPDTLPFDQAIRPETAKRNISATISRTLFLQNN